MVTPVTQASCVTLVAQIRDLPALETPVNQWSVPEPGPSLPQLSTSKSHVISTGNLLQRQQSIRNEQQPKGRHYKSRTAVRRLNLQRKNLHKLPRQFIMVTRRISFWHWHSQFLASQNQVVWNKKTFMNGMDLYHQMTY